MKRKLRCCITTVIFRGSPILLIGMTIIISLLFLNHIFLILSCLFASGGAFRIGICFRYRLFNKLKQLQSCVIYHSELISISKIAGVFKIVFIKIMCMFTNATWWLSNGSVPMNTKLRCLKSEIVFGWSIWAASMTNNFSLLFLYHILSYFLLLICIRRDLWDRYLF